MTSKTSFPDQWDNPSLLRRMKTISELISRPRRWTKFNMTFFFWGSEPAILTLLHGAAWRIWTCDLDLWTAVALSSGCRLRLPAAPLSLLPVNTEKRRNGNIVTRSLTGSYHSVGTYSQLQRIKENWDILLFLLQSSLYLSAFLTLLSLLFSLFFFLLLSTIHPSLPIFSPSPSLPFICLSLPPHPHRHSSFPILIALPTGGHSQAWVPAGCIVSTTSVGRSIDEKREKSSRKKEETVETFVSLSLCPPSGVQLHQQLLQRGNKRNFAQC